jgi:hypothetical protein
MVNWQSMPSENGKKYILLLKSEIDLVTESFEFNI